MDRKERNEKKAMISQFIDFANGKFREADIEKLYELVQNREDYDGLTAKRNRIEESSSSEGRFTRYIENTYRIHCDDKIWIERHCESTDSDDGILHSFDYTYDTARDILDYLNNVFSKKRR